MEDCSIWVQGGSRWLKIADWICTDFYCNPFTNMLEIPPVCRVAQWGLSAWRHNRPTIVSTAANTGQLTIAQDGSKMAPRWLPEDEDGGDDDDEDEDDDDDDDEEDADDDDDDNNDNEMAQALQT